METMTKTYPNGKKVTYKMTREKGFFTNHIWVYKDGRPYLHILRTDEGTGKIHKNCGEYGYLPMCEIMTDFESINLNDVIGL